MLGLRGLCSRSSDSPVVALLGGTTLPEPFTVHPDGSPGYAVATVLVMPDAVALQFPIPGVETEVHVR